MDTEPCSCGDSTVSFLPQWNGVVTQTSQYATRHEWSSIDFSPPFSCVSLEALTVVSDVEGFQEASP